MAASPRFNAVLDKMRQVHDAKNHDYASADDPFSNFRFAAQCAALFSDPLDQVFAALIGIKLARLGQLRSGKTPKNESVADSHLDLTNYSAIWMAVYGYGDEQRVVACGTDSLGRKIEILDSPELQESCVQAAKHLGFL